MFIAIEAKKFLDIVPFISTDETRYYLGGICVDPTNNEKINLVATDGNVAGIHQVENTHYWELLGDSCIIKLSKDFQAIVKKKLALNDKREKLTTYIVIDGDLKGNQATICFTNEDDAGNEKEAITDILAQGAKSVQWQGAEGGVLIDGNYPHYKKIIPDSSKAQGAIVSVDFNTVKKFSHLSDNNKFVPLKFSAVDSRSPILVTSIIKGFMGIITQVNCSKIDFQEFIAT